MAFRLRAFKRKYVKKWPANPLEAAQKSYCPAFLSRRTVTVFS